ncbi:MAG: hypothetical protein K8R87_01230 [Verrucomicrobia bacterium]|nr:hypothetical protein [Verrucomicrobiota bacterium]
MTAVKFENDSPVGIAILGIISIFLAVWAIMTARDPKNWRMWWMALFGRTGLNTTRQQRHRQQHLLSIGGYVVFALMIMVTFFSIYYVIVSTQEQPKARTDYDKAKESAMNAKERIEKTKKFRKL